MLINVFSFKKTLKGGLEFQVLELTVAQRFKIDKDILKKRFRQTKELLDDTERQEVSSVIHVRLDFFPFSIWESILLVTRLKTCLRLVIISIDMGCKEAQMFGRCLGYMEGLERLETGTFESFPVFLLVYYVDKSMRSTTPVVVLRDTYDCASLDDDFDKLAYFLRKCTERETIRVESAAGETYEWVSNVLKDKSYQE